jgi:hypothetical protein
VLAYNRKACDPVTIVPTTPTPGIFIPFNIYTRLQSDCARRSVASEPDLGFTPQFVFSDCLRGHTWDRSCLVAKGRSDRPCAGLDRLGRLDSDVVVHRNPELLLAAEVVVVCMDTCPGRNWI